jgi:hypothetical protein
MRSDPHPRFNLTIAAVDRGTEQITTIPVAVCREPGELVMGFLDDELVLISEAPALTFLASETRLSFVVDHISEPLLRFTAFIAEMPSLPGLAELKNAF